MRVIVKDGAEYPQGPGPWREVVGIGDLLLSCSRKKGRSTLNKQTNVNVVLPLPDTPTNTLFPSPLTHTCTFDEFYRRFTFQIETVNLHYSQLRHKTKLSKTLME